MERLPKSQVIKTLFLFLTLVILFTDKSLHAEAIRLTSGQIVEGRILEESDKIIIIQTSKGTFTIKKIDVLEMERPGSKDVIVKPPEEKKPGVAKVIMMSFIPGYSPLYHSKEHPEFGIPFAMANFVYFYKFMVFQTNSRRVGYLDSTEMKSPFGFITTFGIGPDMIRKEMGFNPSNPSASSNFNFGTSQSQAFYLYLTFRSNIYNKHADRIVGGTVMTEDEYLKIRKRYMANFIASSLIHVAFSYFILNGEGSLGAFYKTEFNGIKTAFYAFPTNDGGIFAAVSRF